MNHNLKQTFEMIRVVRKMRLAQICCTFTSLSQMSIQSEADGFIDRQLGTYIRGALGYGLREISCVSLCEGGPTGRHKGCSEPACPYARGFLALGTEQGAPAPYRIACRALPDQRFEVSITLFGALAEDLLYWIWGLQRALSRGLGQRQQRYQLIKAIDASSGAVLWDLEGSTFPQLPQVSSLGELSATRFTKLMSAYRRGRRRLTSTLLSPLETKLSLASEGAQPIISLELLLRLIVRRAEQLFETYCLPIEPLDDVERITRSELSECVAGAVLHRADLKRLSNKALSRKDKSRPVSRCLGSFTYLLSDHEERSALLLELLSFSEILGVGRAVVEGRGALSYTL